MRNKLLLLLTTQGTVYFGIALFAPLYAIYVEQIGGEFITAGLAIAVFSAVTGTATIFMGRIASFLPHPKIFGSRRLVSFRSGIPGLSSSTKTNPSFFGSGTYRTRYCDLFPPG